MYGLGLVEAGVRNPADWMRHMRADLAPHVFTDYDLSRIWNEARLEYAKGLAERTGDVLRPASAILVDHIAARLGREGAARFMTSIADAPGESPIFEKMAAHEDLTPEELDRAAGAWADALSARARPQPKPSVNPLREIQEAARQLRGSSPVPRSNPVRELLKVVSAKYGADAAKSVRSALAVNGSDAILGKIATGASLSDEERAKATRAFSDVAHYEPPSTKQIDAAREAVRETNSSARDAARDELARARTMADWAVEHVYKDWSPMAPPASAGSAAKARFADAQAEHLERASGFAAAARALPDQNDPVAIAKLMQEHQKASTFGETIGEMWRAGLISSPRTLAKILLSQGLNAASREVSSLPPAAIDALRSALTGSDRTVLGPSADRLMSALRAQAGRGTHEAQIILREGSRGLALRGLGAAPGLADDAMAEARTREFKASLLPEDVPGARAINQTVTHYVNGIYRTHTASYHITSIGAEDASLHEQAHLAALSEARESARSGAPWTREQIRTRAGAIKASPTPEMLEKARLDGQRATFLNPNAVATALGHLRSSSPMIKGVSTWLLPFTRVPVNIMESTLEHVFGLPAAGLKGLYHLAARAPMTAEDAAVMNRFVARGTAGAALMAYGYRLASQKAITAPNRRTYDPGKLIWRGRSYKIAMLGPQATALMVGSAIYYATHSQTKTQRGSAVFEGGYDMLGNSPITAPGEQIDELLTNPARFGGEQAGSVVPQALADATTQYDGKARKTPTPVSIIQSRLPILREKLAASGRAPNALFDPTSSLPVKARAPVGNWR